MSRRVCVLRHLVDSRKTQAEVLDGSLNWLISRSLSEAVVLPSSPLRNPGNKVGVQCLYLILPSNSQLNKSVKLTSYWLLNQNTPSGGSTHCKSMAVSSRTFVPQS